MTRVVLALLAAAAVCADPATAQAADLYALTEDEHVVRFAADAPQTFKADDLPWAAQWNEIRGITSFEGDLVLLDASGNTHSDQRSTGFSGDRGTFMGDSRAGYATGPDGSGHTITSRGWGMIIGSAFGEEHNATGGAVSPADMQLVGLAFSGSTQYAIDTAGDRLMRGAGDGTFTEVGKLDVAVGERAPFEIAEGTGYVALAGVLRRLDLTNGRTTEIGPVGGGDGRAVLDLAIVEPPHVVLDRWSSRGYAQEWDGGWTIPLRRVGDPAAPITFSYASIPGDGKNARDATPDADFTPISGTVTLAPGQMSTNLALTIVDDDEPEPLEKLAVRIDQPYGARSGDVFIVDYGDPEFAATETTVLENAGKAVVEVTRVSDRPGPVAVDLTVAGTATPGLDIWQVPTRVEFGHNEARKLITIPLKKDKLDEPSETVELRLSAPTITRFVSPLRRSTITIADANAPDRSAPRGSVLNRFLRLGRSTTALVRCDEACTATAQLVLDRRRARRLRVPVVLGRGKASRTRAGTSRLRLRIARGTLTRLRRVAPERAKLRLVVTDPAGNRRNVVRVVTLRRG